MAGCCSRKKQLAGIEDFVPKMSLCSNVVADSAAVAERVASRQWSRCQKDNMSHRRPKRRALLRLKHCSRHSLQDVAKKPRRCSSTPICTVTACRLFDGALSKQCAVLESVIFLIFFFFLFFFFVFFLCFFYFSFVFVFFLFFAVVFFFFCFFLFFVDFFFVVFFEGELTVAQEHIATRTALEALDTLRRLSKCPKRTAY